jgi:hypothetical protein
VDEPYFWKLDIDPHKSEKLDLDPHKSQHSGALGPQNGAVEGVDASQWSRRGSKCIPGASVEQ